MKQFIRKSLLIAISWLVVLYAFQAVYDTTAQEVYDRWPYDKINTAYNRPQDADLIILGNSRGAGNYIPQVFDSLMGMKCCNFSLSGFSFEFNYRMVYLPYIKRNKPPKYIIQDVGPFAFFDDINPAYRIEFLPYINKREFDFYLEKCTELSVLERILPIKYYGQMPVCFDNIRSFIAKEGEKPERKYYMADYLWFGGFRPLEKDTAVINLFTHYLEDCKDMGTKVVLVCSPIHTRDGFPRFDIGGFKNLVDSIAKKEGVPFLDYSEYYGADTLFFIDPVHLKKPAQRQFSRQIAEDLKAMGWELDPGDSAGKAE